MDRQPLVLLLVFGLVVPAGAARAEPWDFKAGAGPVYASTFRANEKDGIGFGAYLELGLSESWSLTAGGGYVEHVLGSGEGYALSHAGAGLLYNLDVLVVVPFVSARLGFMRDARDDGFSTSGLGLAVALGLDYLWTENFTVGFAAEYHTLLTDLHFKPAYAAFTLRVGYRLPD